MTKFSKKWSVCVLSVGVLASIQSWAFTFDSNVPSDIQTQMTQDVTFMATLQGSQVSPLHQQIYGAMDGASYKKWFESRITSVGLSDCGDANAVACVSPAQGMNKMWITQNYIKFSHPQIARLMVVYHEARHTEWQHGFWGHATCPVPFLDAQGNDMKSIWTGASLAGEPACDQTPLGSYGSSAILLKNISKFCTDCGSKVQMDAGIFADDQLQRITNKSAHDQMVADVFH